MLCTQSFFLLRHAHIVFSIVASSVRTPDKSYCCVAHETPLTLPTTKSETTGSAGELRLLQPSAEESQPGRWRRGPKKRELSLFPSGLVKCVSREVYYSTRFIPPRVLDRNAFRTSHFAMQPNDLERRKQKDRGEGGDEAHTYGAGLCVCASAEVDVQGPKWMGKCYVHAWTYI